MKTEHPWDLRCKYLWALNQMCNLAPPVVDDMGWFDLAQFTLLIDDEDAERRRTIRLIDAQRNYAQPFNSSGMQRL